MPFPIPPAPNERTVNGFFCTGCNTLLLSLHIHDFKKCACGNMVDGGNSYIRRGYETVEAWEKVVEIYDFAPIFVAAEEGFSRYLTDGIVTIDMEQFIEDERLVRAADAEAPEEGDSIVSDLQPSLQALVEQEEGKKEERDRAKAAALFGELTALSLGGGVDEE